MGSSKCKRSTFTFSFIVGGGAAGVELDRYDLEFGTPHNAFLLARSENHTNLMLQVNEEIHFSVRGYHGGGIP